MISQQILSVSQSLYKFWNIHIHTYFSLHFFCPFSKRNIFLHFKACYIYEEGRKCPQGSTVTHPRVLLQRGDEPQTTRSHLLQRTHTQTRTHRGQEIKHYGGEVSVPRKRKSQKHRGSKMFSKRFSDLKGKKKKKKVVVGASVISLPYLFFPQMEDLVLHLSESFFQWSENQQRGKITTIS